MMKQNIEFGEDKRYGVIGGKPHRSRGKCSLGTKEFKPGKMARKKNRKCSA